ncbi:MAG: redoxin domain-containing protein [Bacteroidia bacterium]|jgi:peroxiredoxin|nr:redoxin domain-containing protein [Bacteroidia bacterium]
MKSLLILWSAIILSVTSAPVETVWQTKLMDLKGNLKNLQQFRSNKATVIYFLSPECPLCQSYSLTINQIYTRFKDNEFNFIGIIPGRNYSVDEIKSYGRKYKLQVELLRDTASLLVNKLQATITPEVFVLNKNGDILYSGRIDNWAYELGRKRTVITEHNLINALQEINAGKQVSIKKTKAVGCFIE